MIYKRIDNANDPDIPYLIEILKLPEISRFLSIDEHNYWTYVVSMQRIPLINAHGFKSIRKLTNISFSSFLHKSLGRFRSDREKREKQRFRKISLLFHP